MPNTPLQETPDFGKLVVVRTNKGSFTGSASISYNTTVTTTIAHGLGYIPAMLVYINAVSVVTLQGGTGITSLPVTYTFPGASQSNPIFTIQSRVDSTNLYIDFICMSGTANNFSSYTWPYQYYLFQSEAIT